MIQTLKNGAAAAEVLAFQTCFRTQPKKVSRDTVPGLVSADVIFWHDSSSSGTTNATGGTMRSILIFTMFGTLLLLPSVSSAETNAECQTRCATEKASRDVSCPSPGEDTDQARAQCLQESQDSYNSCLNSCPQPAPTDTPTEN
jgi:hypothetical protein